MRLKKLFSTLLACTILFTVLIPTAGAAYQESTDSFVFEIDPDILDLSKTKTTSEFLIRDPFVLVYGQKYFMYGTGAAKGLGYGCYVSEDLKNWAGPVNVFSAPSDFDGTNNFWAPECHYYNGNFYLFATYFSKTTQHRGVSIFKSSSPLGPFEEITNGHITPHDWDAIDGTLYIDEDDQPWMVFVHEWTCTDDGVGRMDAAKLSDDLTTFIEDPIELFRANDPVWTSSQVTDGPFLYKNEKGKLMMLWSNGDSTGNYAVALSSSDNGKLTGNWKHGFRPLYRKGRYFPNNGGHPMLFTDLNDHLMMGIHSPNNSTPDNQTAAMFYEIQDTDNTLKIAIIEQKRAQTSSWQLFLDDAKENFNDLISIIKIPFKKLGNKIENFFK